MHRICNAARARALRGFESPSRLSFGFGGTCPMLMCVKCGGAFSLTAVIDGKVRNLGKRRYCLICSPFGRHNTRRIHLSRSENTCAACGSKTENPKFCSNKCQRDHDWERTRRKIENAGAVPVGACGHSATAKRYLLVTRGHVCEICHGRKWRGGPMPLVLDHIDGNSGNWALANLRLVCGNCDMQLSTYKSRNRGHGRVARRKRYANGQSY
jgi:hypothetical protein